MHQFRYAKDLLRKLNMQQSNPVGTSIKVGLVLEKEIDEELVDPTLYWKIVFVQHKAYLSFSVGLINIFMQEPRQSHLVAKKILRYVQETIDFGVLFPKGEEKAKPALIGYSDSYWCRDKRYIFFYGGAPISLSSTKEHVVALLSCEVEYIVTSKTICQAIWLEALMKDLQVKILGKIKLLIDNKSTINLARHPATHGKNRHIETRFHFLREQVNNEKLRIEHYRTKI
ncbi:hypothetical protein CR513_53920, partial [Mucuna pruriens]